MNAVNEPIINLQKQLSDAGYIADEDLVTTLLLMKQLDRPLLIEGEAGVGKTEIAKVLARINDTTLIRLQCYEGLDTNSAVYEWNYSHQLLSIKLSEHSDMDLEKRDHQIFSEKYLLERPLLKAIRQSKPAVLLIDEIDRTDEAFEAFLLELLSDFQISIPELGTIHAESIPMVVLTSNGTRELSDALRRRCLYYYLDYPTPDKELQIIRNKIPDLDTKLSGQIVHFINKIRDLDLNKRPGVAETLDWSAALHGQSIKNLDDNIEIIFKTRTCLLKTRDDLITLNKGMIHKLIETM